MIKADFHLHTTFSTDGISSMEEMIQGGIDKGLETLCFTEHMDYDNSYDEGPGAYVVDTSSYYKCYLELKEKYQDQIELLFGVELGLQPHLKNYYHSYIYPYPFDFIIGSSHLAGGIDPFNPAYFEGRSEEEAYHFYFETIVENARIFDDYDVYGHLDYALRYGKNRDLSQTYRNNRELIDTILTILIQKGKGIEVNTSGYHYDMNGPHPHISILKRYHELGGEIITIGSDAHKQSDIAAEFKKAADVLEYCGYHYYTQFRKRLPEFLPL